MKIGYARVSTEDQSLEMQRRALRGAGCEHIYEEKVSGAAKNRKQLALALKELREGDTLIVWKLDRLARSSRQLLGILDQIVESEAKLKSITEELDISTAIGRLIITFLGGFAEFERAIISERTTEGIKLAQERGVRFGRKPSLTPAKKKLVLAMVRKGKLSNKAIAVRLKVSPSTIQNFLKAERERKPRKYLNRRKP